MLYPDQNCGWGHLQSPEAVACHGRTLQAFPRSKKKLLKRLQSPLWKRTGAAVQDGCAQVNITARENGVVYFEVKAVEDKSDRGYCYKE